MPVTRGSLAGAESCLADPAGAALPGFRPAAGRERGWRPLLLALLLAALPVGAQEPADSAGSLGDLSLEDLLNLRIERVVTASKYEQRVTRAPAAVTIISSEEIQQFGYRTLADLLRAIRGVYVTYDRNYSNLGVRGFGRPGDFNTRVLFLVDGHRMNDNLYGSALVGREAGLDLELIDRVEFIRGPSSSIYGNSAFFGVINVITRSAAQIDGIEATVEGGSLSTYRGQLLYGRRHASGLEVTVAASGFGTAGSERLYFPEFDRPETNGGIAEDSDDESVGRVFGRVAAGHLTLSAAYTRREKSIPTAAFGTAFNAGVQVTTDERTYVDLKFERALSPDTRILARAAYDWYGFEADYPYDVAAPGAPSVLAVSHDASYGDGIGAELQVTHRFSRRQTAVLGAEYRIDLNLVQTNFNDDPRTYNFRSNRQGRSLALYGQTEVELSPQLLLNAGLRYDNYDSFGGTLNPRLGLIYNPRAATTFKLLYGRAFRAPNGYERYLEAEGFNRANPGLRPENVHTFELVLEQYLPRGLLLTASAYRYDLRRLITQQRDAADGALVFRNADPVDARGLEVGLERRTAAGLLVRATYAWQEVEDRKTGRALDNSPSRMAKVNLSLPFAGGLWSAGLEAQYLSGLRTLAGNQSRGFALANVTILRRKLAGRYDLALSVYNLFDRRYSYPGSTGHTQDLIPQDGRSLRLRIAFGF